MTDETDNTSLDSEFTTVCVHRDTRAKLDTIRQLKWGQPRGVALDIVVDEAVDHLLADISEPDEVDD